MYIACFIDVPQSGILVQMLLDYWNKKSINLKTSLKSSVFSLTKIPLREYLYLFRGNLLDFSDCHAGAIILLAFG